MQIIALYANELDMPIHIHCHETASEVHESLEQYGCRPLQRLRDLGLLLPQTQLVHMTQVDASDISLLQDHNCHVVHCPESNMKLASGFSARWDRLNGRRRQCGHWHRRRRQQ